jgi:hypothetical protein
VEVRNSSRPETRYLYGDWVELVIGISDPNPQPVDSVVEAVVNLNNGRSALGDGRQLAIPVGHSIQKLSFTLPTDWFTTPTPTSSWAR